MHECLLDAAIPTVVQGATGRAARNHIGLMRRYGTRIVAGVSPGHAGEQMDGIPLFDDCRSAVHATGARASVVMVPAASVRAAAEDAVGAGIELIVSITEGVPVHDALAMSRLTRAAGVTWVGSSTPGTAIPGRIKLGFLPDVTLLPGPLGVMTKSGTLSYEVCHRLAQRGIGQSLWVGVGGDPVKGVRFADLVPLFRDHDDTRALVVVGEIGGTEEEELAAALLHHRCEKPVFVLMAGSSAPEGVTMGHAGALIHGAHGSIESKTAALTQAGARVFRSINELVADVARSIAR